MTFEDVQLEYDVSGDDIRAALKFLADFANQKSFHPLPAAEDGMRFLIDANLLRSGSTLTRSRRSLFQNFGRSCLVAGYENIAVYRETV